MIFRTLLHSLAVVFILTVSINSFSTNFYTSADGNYGTNTNWVGNSIGGSFSGYSKWSGPNDTIFIDNNITTNSNFTLGGPYVVFVVRGTFTIGNTRSLTLNRSTFIVDGGTVNITNDFNTSNPSPIIIKNGGTVNVADDMSINNTTLTIENGSTLNVGDKFSTSNTTGSVINLNGEMNIGGDADRIAGTWNINSTGSLTISGDLLNDTGGTTFNISGDVLVEGNTEFHSGTFNINSGGTFTQEGTDLLIGGATINNNGVMDFPNMTNLAAWNTGGFDCNGSGGNGTVGFGAGAFCGTPSAGACAAGSNTKCVNNGAPLPIELRYFSVDIENGNFVFNWETITETNNDYFTVEYSVDLEFFQPLLEVKGAGTSLSSLSYNAISPAFFFEGFIYFRLKQTDFDGKFSYSLIEVVSSTNLISSDLQLFPNPTSGKSLLKVSSLESSKSSVTGVIVSPVSMTIINTVEITNGEAILNFEEYENGVYFLSIPTIGLTPLKIVVNK